MGRAREVLNMKGVCLLDVEKRMELQRRVRLDSSVGLPLPG